MSGRGGSSSGLTKRNVSIGCGGRVLETLLVIFVVLKVLGIAPIAGWSWWLVLLPLWIELGIGLLLILVLGGLLVLELWTSRPWG